MPREQCSTRKLELSGVWKTKVSMRRSSSVMIIPDIAHHPIQLVQLVQLALFALSSQFSAQQQNPGIFPRKDLPSGYLNRKRRSLHFSIARHPRRQAESSRTRVPLNIARLSYMRAHIATSSHPSPTAVNIFEKPFLTGTTFHSLPCIPHDDALRLCSSPTNTISP
ncbi:hypothetical protein N657DRAFT_454012 [Parathielavia appendiculata]|uniref:Uncharacterized protein n=1 Tax=Parathielavia appendiculata TaxID=2587402 RepID=A0AAN6Z399_9PEZI|nr:hypothetical protein N657DRAFT_454012 [Parathielavia appendiculata]